MIITTFRKPAPTLQTSIHLEAPYLELFHKMLAADRQWAATQPTYIHTNVNRLTNARHLVSRLTGNMRTPYTHYDTGEPASDQTIEQKGKDAKERGTVVLLESNHDCSQVYIDRRHICCSCRPCEPIREQLASLSGRQYIRTPRALRIKHFGFLAGMGAETHECQRRARCDWLHHCQIGNLEGNLADDSIRQAPSY